MGIRYSTVKKMMKAAGAPRVSTDAVKTMQTYIEEEVRVFVAKLVVVANANGRNTVRAEDFETVARIMEA